jgi:uncharacterized protein (DUF1697 family)
MHTYSAFLRGVNVSGKHKIPMAELRAILEQAGLDAVKTYIQSGNVVFQSAISSNSKLEQLIKTTIATHFNFDIPVLVLSVKALQRIFDACPFPEAQKQESYFSLVYSPIDQNLQHSLEQNTYPQELFKITAACIYLHAEKGFGKAVCNTNFFERKLKITASTRNYKTMVKLLALSLESDKDH